MINEKEKLLDNTLEKVISICFGLSPTDELEDVFAEKLMVIGTAEEERYTTLDGVRKLIQLQKEQTEGMELSYTRTERYRDLPGDGNIAVVVDDLWLDIKMANQTMGFAMRASAVLEYKNQQWKSIHWHVSKADTGQSNEDTFGVEEWKKRTIELEQTIAERTQELVQQKLELEHALEDLRTTQNQLIQSEKMASLGELTAGIAHEIQNPLNFVNNFSEVSRELIEELKVEKEKLKSERDEDLENDILKDIDSNLEKINYHGKRADAIVKGMLQHSRRSSGIKEPTDINALCDEYLRLSYHGLRAKDKTFNATLNTSFDDTIGNILILSQEMGRVILNLLTNAFYAVADKKKTAGDGYEPTVTIKTSGTSVGGRKGVSVSVADNGNGIPKEVIDKIFQPFFTTKPTGQGTGLGLSMSYDIVTKGHDGELKAESKEGEGTTFHIFLPIQN
jgi:signal transduction histidine kinase